MKPRLLDAGCHRGGATRGYQLAGFYVIGLDIEPQPRYIGDEFHQGDMLTWPLDGYDAIHASPPCQRHANVTRWRGHQDDHPDILTPMLARLANVTTPWVVENVPEALPTWDYILCGSQFGLTLNGRTIKRHRGFRRGNWYGYSLLPPCDHRNMRPFMHKDERAYADAMGCTWMSKEEGRQAIPPAYTEHIGRQLLTVLEQAGAS
jgi:DNA (cytosine-5)-methyltransferase 1